MSVRPQGTTKVDLQPAGRWRQLYRNIYLV